MQCSESRILTTHAGSLPRPAPLVELQLRMSRGEPVDAAAVSSAVRQATRRSIARQLTERFSTVFAAASCGSASSVLIAAPVAASTRGANAVK